MKTNFKLLNWFHRQLSTNHPILEILAVAIVVWLLCHKFFTTAIIAMLAYVIVAKASKNAKAYLCYEIVLEIEKEFIRYPWQSDEILVLLIKNLDTYKRSLKRFRNVEKEELDEDFQRHERFENYVISAFNE